jgi:hypothetical protein
VVTPEYESTALPQHWTALNYEYGAKTAVKYPRHETAISCFIFLEI